MATYVIPLGNGIMGSPTGQGVHAEEPMAE